jgi:two-component system, OmpR family, sensor kinase
LDGGEKYMKKSLQQRLLWVLGSVVLGTGLLASALSFSLAYSDAQELQDDMLRQIAALAIHDAARLPTDSSDSTINDPESRLTVLHLPRDPLPNWLDKALPAGFYTRQAGLETLRVFIQPGEQNQRVVVAQATEVRDEIAIHSALRSLIPSLALLCILLGLIVRIVRSELAPIAELAHRLDQQPADRLQPLESDRLPAEMQPFLASINRLLARVNQMSAQQRRFIADAAHELRSPLTALSLQVQNLHTADSEKTLRERIQPLQTGILRAQQLTEGLLNLAQNQSRSYQPSQVDIAPLVRALIADYLPLAAAKQIDLGMDELASLQLLAEPDSVRLILKNGLENALKYTPNGGEITVRLFTQQQAAVIEIVDSGTGIPEVQQQRVFDAFHRILGTGETGSGLGLTIAREAAMRLGGEVSVQNRESETGLIFRYQQSSVAMRDE